MVGGQTMDIGFEGQFPELHEITRLQHMKTAALIQFSCEAGAIMGTAPPPMRARADRHYGQELGFAFQIADDLLDAEGDAAQMGKAARKDAKHATSPQWFRFWASNGPARRQKPWRNRRFVTLICSMKRPTFCVEQPNSLLRGGRNRSAAFEFS